MGTWDRELEQDREKGGGGGGGGWENAKCEGFQMLISPANSEKSSSCRTIGPGSRGLAGADSVAPRQTPDAMSHGPSIGERAHFHSRSQRAKGEVEAFELWVSGLAV